MSKSLVIVESPAKAKSINKYLGSEYKVMASVGHVRDLPPKKLGVDVNNSFCPEYIETERGKKIINELKDEAKKCERIYLAPDPDREGEAIAWHLYEALKETINNDQFFRVTYNEVTKSAILSAFDSPKKIDMNRVNAQQARRILDRLVGFEGSPVVRRQIRGASSVGRVQTVALRLVVSREEEITNFSPEKYFTIGVLASKKDNTEPFELRLVKINNQPIGVKDRKLLPESIKNEDELNNIQNDLKDCELKISDISSKEVSQKPKAPFITSTLQQAASGALNFSPSRTMSVAQKLYENGFITYMRTDSYNISQTAQQECKQFILNEYGEQYVPEKFNNYVSGAASAQEAHEAIRPTNSKITPELSSISDSSELKLYSLIWKRFIASQMVPAKIMRRVVEANVLNDNEYLFKATSSDVIFPGFMKVSGVETSKRISNQNDDNEETNLPELEINELLNIVEWLTDKKETKPLPRFTEAKLIKALEENGVGRPSTYAAIMSKLFDREYVEKIKKTLVPTNVGKELIGLIIRTEEKYKDGNSIDLFEVNFTASMEEKLDEIAQGKMEWTSMMNNFYPFLCDWIEHAKEKADSSLVNELLDALSHVSEWAEPVKSGKKTYDDHKTYLDFKDSSNNNEDLTAKQGDFLFKMACRYYNQIPSNISEKLNLIKPQAVRDDTARKLSLFDNITFNEPNKIGKRVYDDSKFVNSLSDQVALGKRLSEKQIAFLDKLILKYGNQIDELDSIKSELGLDAISTSEVDETIAPILEIMENISTWAEPVKRGKMEFNDKSFFDSLSTQFKNNGSLSDRQVGALKKMVARYADQIPDYHDKKDSLGLPEPRKPKEKKETEEV